MSLSKRAEDKRPIPAERAKAVLTPKPKKKIEVSVQKPSVMGTGEISPLSLISISGGKDLTSKYKLLSEPSDIKSLAPKKYEAGYTPLEVFDRNLENTISYVANNMGISKPEKGSSFYNTIKNDILKNKKDFVLTKDQEGNPIFGTGQTAAQSFLNSLNYYGSTANKGFSYFFGDENANKRLLEDRKVSTSIPSVPRTIPSFFGSVSKPLAQGITGAIAGASAAGPYGAVGGFLIGAGTTFALSSPEAVGLRYAESLESNYYKAREQGMSVDDAYKSASQTAKVAAGGEVVMQGVFATFGAPGTISTSKLFKDGAKQAFSKSLSSFINKGVDAAKSATFIGTEAALAKGAEVVESEKQGIKVESPIEESLKYGGEFALMDLGIRSVIGGIGAVPNFVKAQAKSFLNTADKNFVREAVSAGESSGIYPEGSTANLMSELSSQKKASSKSPKYPGDEAREGVVSGLTEKLNKLIDKQSKLDEIHKSDVQPQIDDIKNRIEIAKKAEDPFEAERFDDGTPVVKQSKTEQNATEISKGEVQEIAPESGIPKREGTDIVKQEEVSVAKTTDEANIGNRPIGGTEEVVTPEQIPLADKIRRFKIDESILTGGDKGVAQSNIAGLPIAIYNASIEAIAKGVEAGGKLAELIDEQIKRLIEGGHKVDERKFRKDIEMINRVSSSDAARVRSEVEMQGVKSGDYVELQRLALEKYNEGKGITDPYEMGARLRQELDKKMDTSQISDDVFEMIAYDAIANKEQAPFISGPTQRNAPKLEQIVTNPKEVFKSMYAAATNVGKDISARLEATSNMIAEYIKAKDKLVIPAKDITRAIRSFVTDKMDTETASEVFAENLSDIIMQAKNTQASIKAKAQIKKIKKNARSSAFSTIASKETTAGVEFLSPSKIVDELDINDPTNVIVPSSEKLARYNDLLDDYNNSISGRPTRSNTARKDLIDFLDAERKNFDRYTEIKNQNKRAAAGEKYDKLVSDKKIDPALVGRDEFIDGYLNPSKIVSEQADDAINTELEQTPSVIERYKAVIDGKQESLRKAVEDGDIEPEYIDDVTFLLDKENLKDISPKNLKRMAVVMEDILNGEAPSMMGEFRSDVSSAKAAGRLTGIRVRDISKTKTSGLFRGAVSAINKLYQGSVDAFDELGLGNFVRAITMSGEEEGLFRSTIIGDFERKVNEINTTAKGYIENLGKIFTGKSAVINGQNVSFAGEKILTEMNSHKLGMIASFLNFENFENTLDSIIKSTIKLSEDTTKRYRHTVSERIKALENLGIIKGVTQNKYGKIENIDVNTSITLDDILASMSNREKVALDYIISKNKEISSDLQNTMRQYYGKTIDISNPNYVSMRAFFTDDVESFTSVYNKPIFDMMASSTYERNKEMLFQSQGDNGFIHYDFDIFNAAPRSFHESLITAYTSDATKSMMKLFNRKDFQDFIKGKYNIDPTSLNDNLNVFKNVVTEYINGQRQPYVITREMAKQRQSLARHFYGLMLNSLDAGIKQYVPNIPSLLIEDPGGFVKSVDLSLKAVYNDEIGDALTKFLSQTSKASRVTSGIEALRASSKSLSDSELLRTSINTYKNFIEKPLGASLEIGDSMTTTQALLTGYIKGLKKLGKLKSANEFDLVAEVEKGLDQDALSFAEQFMSFINNESSSHARAKVFRRDGASILRMLQSFSHNASTNALIDLGRFTDPMATINDRIEAAKRMSQYLMTIGFYGVGVYGLNELRTKMAKDFLSSSGVVKDGEELDKNLKEKSDRTKQMIATGAITDAVLSRQNVVASQAIKGLLGAGWSLYGDKVRKEKIESGEPDVAKDYSPFFENKYLGVSGSFISEFERITNGDLNEEDYRYLSTEKQREAASFIKDMQLFGLITPSKDIKNLMSSAQKVLKAGKITQLEVDAMNYRAAYGLDDVSPAVAEAAREELDNRAKAYGNRPDFDGYLARTVKPYAEVKMEEDVLKSKAKGLGEKFASEVISLKKSSANRKMAYLNNRYPARKIEDRDIKFLIENKVISPMDYGLSFAFDKNGNERKDISKKEIYDIVFNAYVDALVIKEGTKIDLTPKEVIAFYNNLGSELFTRKKVRE